MSQIDKFTISKYGYRSCSRNKGIVLDSGKSIKKPYGQAVRVRIKMSVSQIALKIEFPLIMFN